MKEPEICYRNPGISPLVVYLCLVLNSHPGIFTYTQICYKYDSANPAPGQPNILRKNALKGLRFKRLGSPPFPKTTNPSSQIPYCLISPTLNLNLHTIKPSPAVLDSFQNSQNKQVWDNSSISTITKVRSGEAGLIWPTPDTSRRTLTCEPKQLRKFFPDAH